MITIKKFEEILESRESSLLDFKSKMYDLFNSNDSSGTAKFVKDVVCFTNTIRKETSYIIIGVMENEDGSKELVGMDCMVDDALLQDKIKDKVYPRPNFLFCAIDYNGKTFGILEFPVTKYPLPISPIVKGKGLEIGRIYYRSGTSNTEAIGHEIIAIANWLHGLKSVDGESSVFEIQMSLIRRLTKADEIMSVVLADNLAAASKFRLTGLIDFCTNEIRGFDTNTFDSNTEGYEYRVQTLKISILELELNPHFKVTENMVNAEIGKHKDFHDLNMFFPYSIIQIEDSLRSFNSNPNVAFGTISLSARQMFPDWASDKKVFAYVFKSTYESLYRAIRQKAIDGLMKVHL